MLKLNVGLSKKVGEPDYGSRGASVNLELELDAGLAEDPDRLRDRIRQLFGLARGAIQEELTGNTQPTSTNGNGQSASSKGNGNGHSPRAATQSQVRALYAITRRQNVDLAEMLQERFGFRQPDQLSLRDASTLIDELKGTTNGSRP